MPVQDQENDPLFGDTSVGKDDSLEEERSAAPTPVAQSSPKPIEMEEGRPPTPVRTVMAGEEEQAEGGGDDSRRVHDPETGVDWVVTVSGRSSSGVLPLRTVPILELSFATAEDPERRALCSGGDLSDLTDQELFRCYKRSEPHREALPPSRDKSSSGKRGKNRRGS